MKDATKRAQAHTQRDAQDLRKALTHCELHPKLLSKDAAPLLVIPAFLVYFSWLLLFRTHLFLGSPSPFLKIGFIVILTIFLLTFISRLSRGFLRLTDGEIQYWRPGGKKLIQRISLKDTEEATIDLFHYRTNASYNAICLTLSPEIDSMTEEPRNMPLPIGRKAQDSETQAFLRAVNEEIRRLHDH